jgi:hypothetical protein
MGVTLRQGVSKAENAKGLHLDYEASANSSYYIEKVDHRCQLKWVVSRKPGIDAELGTC